MLEKPNRDQGFMIRPSKARLDGLKESGEGLPPSPTIPMSSTPGSENHVSLEAKILALEAKLAANGQAMVELDASNQVRRLAHNDHEKQSY